MIEIISQTPDQILELDDGQGKRRRFELMWAFSEKHGRVMPELEEVEYTMYVVPPEALR
jgi:hypothetical protein